LFFVGNADDFFTYAKSSYNQDVPSNDSDLLAEIAAENVANGIHPVQ
jgi:hypothetical protein